MLLMVLKNNKFSLQENYHDSLLNAVGTYIPHKEVVVDETIRATVIKPNQAIKLRPRRKLW